jgi:hypothetical protein
MNDSKPPTFWQTLPGMLTALAGVITAVAGLIVAFDQIRARTARAPETEHARVVDSQVPAASHPSGVQQPAAVRAPVVALTVGTPTEVAFQGGTLVFGVLAARLEPFNPDTRFLRINLRITNNMKSLDRSYYSELRALADGIPLAPESPPLEQIEAHSVKDLAYDFRVPMGVRTLALRITHMEEVGDIPLHMK